MGRSLGEAIEMVVGILAVFTVAAIVVTVVREVRGEDALAPALAAGALLGVEALLWWLRGKANAGKATP